VRLRRRAANVRRRLLDIGRVAAGRRADGRRRSPTRSIRDIRLYVAVVRAPADADPAILGPKADLLYAGHPEIVAVQRTVSTIGMRRGDLTAPLDATRRLRRRADSPVLARRERDLAGRLRETEPGWIPRLDGPGLPIEPRSAAVVMHLLKASLPDRQSGYTIRSRETLRAQRLAALEPFVVTPYGYPPGGGPGPDRVDIVDGIAHHRLSPGAATDELPVDDLLTRTAAGMARVAMAERPAIIQAASGHRGYENALAGLALRHHLGRPLVYEVRGFLETAWTSDLAAAETAEWTARRFATEVRVMTAADGITTLSDAMRDELVGRGIVTDKITVVPNGIDPLAFTPMTPDPELRASYGLDGRWVFGYVSNMDHAREGHELLIEATARLVRAGLATTCLLVGDGARRARLEAAASAAGVRDSVVFTGRVPYDEVRAHYALLDAFVVPRLPDRAASFVTPLKPFEAMAMGLPLIVSQVAALLDIVAPEERGLAFPVGDATALATLLGRLHGDPALARRLGDAGRAWVLAERTWAANGPRYRDLYGSILERFDPAAAMAAPLAV
jgi:glycosyltransferase involved in cell wall biosynthesis